MKMKIKMKITKNAGIKLLSLLVAVVVWIIIINVVDPEVTRVIEHVPVKVDDTALVKSEQCYSIESGKYVDVTVRGKKSIVDGMEANDIEAEANLENIMYEVFTVKIDVKFKKNYKERPRIVKGDNEVMKLKVEAKKRKDFKVKVDLDGKPPSGYYVSEKEVSPSCDTVKIEGPETVIDKIKEVIAIVDVSEVNKLTTKRHLEIKALDENKKDLNINKQLSFNKEWVDVTIEPLIEKKVKINVQTSGDVADGYAIKGDATKSVSEVTVAGDRLSIEKAKEGIMITVDTTNASKNLSEEFNISDYIDDKSLKIVSEEKKVRVEVKIEFMESKKLEFKAYEIRLINKENATVSYDRNKSLTVTVKGLSDEIANVDISECTPYIDVKELSEGRQKAKVQFENINSIRKVDTPILEVEVIRNNTSNEQ